MIAFFLTNRTNPSSFSIPRLLKNNWKEIICINTTNLKQSMQYGSRSVWLSFTQTDIMILYHDCSGQWGISCESKPVCPHFYLCVECHRRPLCILSHFMPVVEVVGEGWLLVFVHQVWVGAVCSYGHCQQAMHYNICIPVQEGRWRWWRGEEGERFQCREKGKNMDDGGCFSIMHVFVIKGLTQHM